MNQGWIKLHRKIKHSPIWNDPHYLKLWIHCLLKASYEDREVFENFEAVQLKMGQFITGRLSLADEMNEGKRKGMKDWRGISTWWRYLEKLEELGMLEIHSTTKHTIVTVLNWEQYQKDEVKQGQPKVVEVPQEEKKDEVPDFPDDLANEDDYRLIDNELPKVMEFYQANRFGAINDYIYSKITHWCSDLNHELVVEAMKIAIENNALKWNYVEAILKNWASKNITTIEQAEAEQLKRQAEREQKQSRNYGNRPIRQEKLPDWYGKQKKDEPEQVDEEKRQRLLAIQAKYKKETGT